MLPVLWRISIPATVGQSRSCDGQDGAQKVESLPVDHPRPAHPLCFHVPESGRQGGECRAGSSGESRLTESCRHRNRRVYASKPRHRLIGGSDSRKHHDSESLHRDQGTRDWRKLESRELVGTGCGRFIVERIPRMLFIGSCKHASCLEHVWC